MSDHYGTLVAANTYFGERLHTDDWDRSSVADRIAAMSEATELIDQFDYIGEKHAVQVVLDAAGCSDAATLRAAELSQELEFPRGLSEIVPAEIEQAAYLIAKALLSGREPDMDLEGLHMKSASYSGVRTNYDRNGNTQEHIEHLIPSPEAFTLLRPFFRDRDVFDVKKS